MKPWSWRFLRCAPLCSRRKRSPNGSQDYRRSPTPWLTSPGHSRSNETKRPTRIFCSGSRPPANQSLVINRDITSSVSGETRSRLATIGEIAMKMALSMEFGFLLNTERMLLSIGFVSPQGALDENCYDLLASEARLASYVGIAKGDLPARHWFHLAHDVTPVGADTALISWSGSMFEYLMPSLVMRAPTMSVLEQTNRVIVRRQIEYGASLGTPWGILRSPPITPVIQSLPISIQTSEFQGLV